jgi:4-diphosphocytidyl-2-C-methyl-D-erythritol kinase
VRASAAAKINLALVVGPLRNDGKHELVTIYQRIGLADRIDVEPAARTRVDGFEGDTLVRDALELLAVHTAVDQRWHAKIEKRIPVAAGLGGGSSDAATALLLANDLLEKPLPREELHDLAAQLGADVPFFLVDGPRLGSGDGTTLAAIDLPQDFWIVLVLPKNARKPSTASVYAAFDERGGAEGWAARRAALLDALERVKRPRDLAVLPTNDLSSSPLAEELIALGAFRADVSGAGPTVYGLFHHEAHAKAAKRALRRAGQTWLTAPAWYG